MQIGSQTPMRVQCDLMTELVSALHEELIDSLEVRSAGPYATYTTAELDVLGDQFVARSNRCMHISMGSLVGTLLASAICSAFNTNLGIMLSLLIGSVVAALYARQSQKLFSSWLAASHEVMRRNFHTLQLMLKVNTAPLRDEKPS